MERKGLCSNCRNNSSCIFPASVPVVHCEEHSIETAESKRTVEKAKMKNKR